MRNWSRLWLACSRRLGEKLQFRQLYKEIEACARCDRRVAN
jgi:hypothetical protein